MHPHSKVWFARRTKLFEPKITSITPITRNPTCTRTQKFGSQSEPNFSSQKLRRLPLLPVIQCAPALKSFFAKRTKLLEPKIMSITPITRNPTCTRTQKFGSRSEPNFSSQKLRRLPLLPVIQRAAALKSLVREANQTFRAKNYVDYPYYP